MYSMWHTGKFLKGALHMKKKQSKKGPLPKYEGGPTGKCPIHPWYVPYISNSYWIQNAKIYKQQFLYRHLNFKFEWNLIFKRWISTIVFCYIQKNVRGIFHLGTFKFYVDTLLYFIYTMPFSKYLDWFHAIAYL
jgi:hypothetical protein